MFKQLRDQNNLKSTHWTKQLAMLEAKNELWDVSDPYHIHVGPLS